MTQTETTAKPSMESFSELLDQSFQEMTSIEGSVVSGTVISIEKDMILIDVGLKCEGRVPLREFGNNDEDAKINVGDKVEVYIERLEDINGHAILSREKARREEAWVNLEDALQKQQRVNGIIFGKVKGGFTVDIDGATAFLPGSQVDIRPIKEKSGITEEDIAKRLIDYGYHAPTMSWPVSGTIMIEPTESENLEEIDRFCNALLSIKDEIDKIDSGKFQKKDNPVINAPHTYLELSADEWKHSYSRKEAAFPHSYLQNNKYWSPVARIDNVYGDRNLFCSCPPLDEYEELENTA